MARSRSSSEISRLYSGRVSAPAAGSDVVSLQLKADAVQGGYVLNGTKFWITNGHQAEVLVVYAKTDPAAGSKGITAFVIENGFEGFRPAQKIGKLGMRGSPTSELVFDNCEVPEENVLGAVGQGRRSDVVPDLRDTAGSVPHLHARRCRMHDGAQAARIAGYSRRPGLVRNCARAH